MAHFIAEVFGGPALYSTEEGSHFKMIQKHLSKHLTEQHRKRWAAFVAYIEWGTRIAVLNSNETDVAMNPGEPMPKWGWGVPGKPFQAGT